MEWMDILKGRRTYRRFKQTPVGDDVVQDMLTAARYASSAANKQPLRYIVVKTPEKVREVFACTKWAGYLPPEEGQPKSGEEPVLFIAVVEEAATGKYADTDAGLAISNMTLAAWIHGVGSCIIGAFHRTKLMALLGLTEEQTLHSVVAFGYPTHTSRIEDAEGDEIKYYLDENKNYVVPKRKLTDVVRYL